MAVYNTGELGNPITTMSKSKKPSPSKQRRSRNRLNNFNAMVKKAIYLNYHYPGLDIRPVRNYFGGGGTYDVVWYQNYPEVHIAVLEEDHEIKIKVTQGLLNATLKPDKRSSLFQNLKKFKDMFSLECSEDYWRSLMRDVVRHNVDKNVKCGDKSEEACVNYPLCSTLYNILKPWGCDDKG